MNDKEKQLAQYIFDHGHSLPLPTDDSFIIAVTKQSSELQLYPGECKNIEKKNHSEHQFIGFIEGKGPSLSDTKWLLLTDLYLNEDIEIEILPNKFD